MNAEMYLQKVKMDILKKKIGKMSTVKFSFSVFNNMQFLKQCLNGEMGSLRFYFCLHFCFKSHLSLFDKYKIMDKNCLICLAGGVAPIVKTQLRMAKMGSSCGYIHSVDDGALFCVTAR